MSERFSFCVASCSAGTQHTRVRVCVCACVGLSVHPTTCVKIPSIKKSAFWVVKKSLQSQAVPEGDSFLPSNVCVHVCVCVCVCVRARACVCRYVATVIGKRPFLPVVDQCCR